MGQRADVRDPGAAPQLGGLRAGDHAAVADEDQFAQAETLLQFGDFVHDSGLVLGVAGKNLHGHRAALRRANQPDDDLLMALPAVAVVPEGHEAAALVGAFHVGTGDVVKHRGSRVGSQFLEGEGSLDGLPAGEQTVHRLVAMPVDIDRSVNAAQFPQDGVGPLLRELEFAPAPDQTPGDHREAIARPLLGTRVNGFVQPEPAGHGQNRRRGTVFAAAEKLEGFAAAFGHDVAAEGRLEQSQPLEWKTGETSVIGVADLAAPAEGRADDPVYLLSPALDLEMKLPKTHVATRKTKITH